MKPSERLRRTLEEAEPTIDPTVFLESVEAFRAHMLTAGAKPHTVEQYCAIVKRVAKEAGRPIVTAEAWNERSLKRIEDGIKQQTRRLDQIAFDGYIKFLHDPHYGWLERFVTCYGAEPINPIHSGNRIEHVEDDEAGEDVHAITLPEFRALLNAVDDDARNASSARERRNALRDGCLYRVQGAYGLRDMEPPPLKRSSWSPYRGLPYGDFSVVTVYGKSKRFGTLRRREVYTVPQFDWITQALKHHVDHVMPLFTRGDPELLFRSEDGSALDPHYISARFAKYRGKVGLSAECTPHGLRRMYATQLALAGVDIYFIQSQLGHSSVATTMRYIKLPRDYVVRMVREAQSRMRNV